MKRSNPEYFIIAPITADEISDLIYNLKSSKSVGPYSIFINIKTVSKEMIYLPLSQLVNDSISKLTFLIICRLAQVTPIFKNDSRLCNYYKPISLLSKISKIFGKVIHSKLNLF